MRDFRLRQSRGLESIKLKVTKLKRRFSSSNAGVGSGRDAVGPPHELFAWLAPTVDPLKVKPGKSRVGWLFPLQRALKWGQCKDVGAGCEPPWGCFPLERLR